LNPGGGLIGVSWPCATEAKEKISIAADEQAISARRILCGGRAPGAALTPREWRIATTFELCTPGLYRVFFGMYDNSMTESPVEIVFLAEEFSALKKFLHRLDPSETLPNVASA